MNMKKSVCANFKWNKKELAHDPSSWRGMTILENCNKPIKFLGFRITYSQAGSENCAEIKDKIRKKLASLRFKGLHPSMVMNIINTISTGVTRYFTQLGHYTELGLDNIDASVRAAARRAIHGNDIIPCELVHRDRRDGGLGIKRAKETAAIGILTTLYKSTTTSS
ncbi:hypothetical protein AKO1_002756 [Acrasis kona]|uniref:Uncharacterized protein n=1 Tax=Acrasis kona TaxID=1008807 RepID=A0AAW2YQF7_9EUKA